MRLHRLIGVLGAMLLLGLAAAADAAAFKNFRAAIYIPVGATKLPSAALSRKRRGAIAFEPLFAGKCATARQKPNQIFARLA